MILTTPTKHSFTTTKHNHKGYIFTLYLFMLLCVVGNCLLFYCSCTGNCENCCGINGLLRIANIDQDGKVDGNNILNKLFVNGEYKASVNVSIYRGSTEKDYEAAKKEFLESIDTKVETTYLIAYVEVGDIARYFIHCKDANSIKENGLFDWSEATKIEILSCGNNITNMSWMFYNCSSLTNLDLSNFNTDNVTDMFGMFYNCFKEEQTSTLICKASTIQKITEKENSCLTITNKINNEIKNTIANNNNLKQVCICSVKRGGSNPEITAVVEYKQQQ